MSHSALGSMPHFRERRDNGSWFSKPEGLAAAKQPHRGVNDISRFLGRWQPGTRRQRPGCLTRRVFPHAGPPPASGAPHAARFPARCTNRGRSVRAIAPYEADSRTGGTMRESDTSLNRPSRGCSRKAPARTPHMARFPAREAENPAPNTPGASYGAFSRTSAEAVARAPCAGSSTYGKRCPRRKASRFLGVGN